MGFTQREARTLVRRAVKRVPEGESIRHLNIMPMMDMMTILLVAFIAQATANDATIAAGTVSLPRSETSDEMTEQATTIVITPSAVTVEGKQIASIGASGDVGCEDKLKGCNGLQITKLTQFLDGFRQQQLASLAQQGRQETQPPELLVIADRLTHWGLLISVMYSAKCFEWENDTSCKRVGFQHFRMVVQKNFPPQPK